jgi:SPFH domain / Band 7 family
MSSDWNEPGATWQNTPSPDWTQSPDLIPPQHVEDDHPVHAQQGTQAHAPEAHNVRDASFSPEQDIFPDNEEIEAGEELDSAEDLDPVTAPDSLRKQVWYYVTLIVFPLLFLGIACLLILLPMATRNPPLSATAFWFVAIVLLLIAIGQGVAVYFSGPEPHMWILGTVGGLILFLLFGVFVVAGPLPSTVLLLVFLGAGVYLARHCIHLVADGFVDIVYASGKYKRTLLRGFNLIWPWETIAHQVNIEETNSYCDLQTVQLSPEEYVRLRAAISYQVVPQDAYLAVTRTKDLKEDLRNLLETTLQTIATHFEPTDFVPWPRSLQAYQAQTAHRDPHLPDEGVDDFSGGPARRERINTLLFQQMRDRVALWGVQINWVLIRDIELVTHKLAGISARPILSDYTKATSDDQVERELVAASSIAQPNKAQSVDTPGNASPVASDKHISLDQETTEVTPTEAFSTTSQPSQSQKLPSEEILKKTYEQVRNGKVTDPEYIRKIAMTFEAAARDPEANQKITFDIERAVTNLYKQAEHYERLYQSDELYSDVTQPE